MEIIENNIKGHGGVCGWKCDVVKLSSVESFSYIRQSYTFNEPVLESGESWDSLNFVQETPFPEEVSDFKDGRTYFFIFNGIITRPNAQRLEAVKNYEDEKLIIRFTDQNGSTYIVGNLKEPAFLTINDRTWNNKRGDRFQAGISIEWSGRNSVPEYLT